MRGSPNAAVASGAPVRPILRPSFPAKRERGTIGRRADGGEGEPQARRVERVDPRYRPPHGPRVDEDEERHAFSGWTEVYDQLGRLAERLWISSKQIETQPSDPRTVSNQLFKRLVHNRRAFSLLWQGRLTTDAEVILRTAIEAAICLANNAARPTEFYEALRSDAARTLRGQIPIWASVDPELGEDARADHDQIFGARNPNGKHWDGLDFKLLAERANISKLHDWHRTLSGTAAHVTGISLITDSLIVGDADHAELIAESRRRRRRLSLTWMAGVMQISCRSHAITLGLNDFVAEADELTATLNKLSSDEV